MVASPKLITNRKSKLKIGDLTNQGNDLLEQTFHLLEAPFVYLETFYVCQRAEPIEFIIKVFRVPKEISKTIEKQNKESYATQSKMRLNALIQNKDFEQAITII